MTVEPAEITWVWDAPAVDTQGRPLTEPLTYEVDCNALRFQTTEPRITLPVGKNTMQIVRVRANSGGGTWGAWSNPASFNMPEIKINAGTVSFIAVPPAFYKLLWRASLTTEGGWYTVWHGFGNGQEPIVHPLKGSAGFYKLTAEIIAA